MPSPSHKSFSVTTPGFWLLPYKMFLTVDGATPDSKPSERLFQRILHIRADFARKLLTSKKKYDIIYTFVILGRRQAVRHRTLTPAFAGSNPAVPARKKHLYKASAFFNEICRCATREMAAPWNAPAVREISASRMLKGKFHITESAALYFTICDKQIISHWAKAKYFTI